MATQEELSIIGHVVVEPRAWAEHAENYPGALEAKVEKYREAYLTASVKPGYKTRAESDDEEEAQKAQAKILAIAQEEAAFQKRIEDAVQAALAVQ
jgi:hypothetical protein|tara:strand:+ start:663 stop:950 length:288 start_codon:yes stop_codon:yes gene_type:complete